MQGFSLNLPKKLGAGQDLVKSGPEVKLMGFPPPHSYPAISGRSSGTAISFRCWSKSEDNRHKHSVTGVGRPESQVDGEKPPP